MELVSGMPAIAYLNSRNHTLNYIRATSADGSTWTDPLELDFAGGFDYFTGPYPGRHASLAIVDGKPAIAYFGGHDLELGSMLVYIAASDAIGSAWNDPLQLHSGDPSPGSASGVYCSLAVISGKPAVSFHNMGEGDLLYVAAEDSAGATWFAAEHVDCIGDVGRWTSLAELANGEPGISYYDATNQNLKFATPSE
jgi:hypothetical protein